MNLHQFEQWLVDVEKIEVTQDRDTLASWAARHDKSGDDSRGEYVRYICESFETIEQHSDGLISLSGRGHNSIEIATTNPKLDFMPALRISDQQAPATLRDFRMKELLIDFDISNDDGDFTLSSLIVSRLTLKKSSSRYRLIDCLIGTLTLHGQCARDFEVCGGKILNIICPPPTGDNPFAGSVRFDSRVYLPNKSGRLLRGAQAYRNLRSHMTKLENGPMVSRFHKLEQLVERENMTWFDALLSRGYWALSDYGSSSLRPVGWLVSLILVTFVLALADGGATSDNLEGWQKGLRGEECVARTERAFILAFQATLNPLGVLGMKGVVVAKSGWLASWLGVHGLISTVFVALFVFAVRRRFKVS